MKRFPFLRRSVSVTTRAPRAGEVEGEHYFFRSQDEFRRMAERGDLLEWTTYLDECYGTPRAAVEQSLAAGEGLLFEIDVTGARNIKAAYREAVLVFVAPPSWEALAQRLRGRQSESAEALERRLELARREVACAGEYDYVIVNDDLDQAVEVLCAIITAERARPGRVDLSPLTGTEAKR